MREYDVTTNTDLSIAVPTLTITVRAAFFVPRGCLPIEDASETRGRETWVSGQAVLPTFEMSQAPIGEGALSMAPVLDLDGEPIVAKRVSVASGVAFTGVRYSKGLGEDKRHEITSPQVPAGQDGQPKSVGLAKIPLFGKKRGAYVVKVVPPAAETTTPDGPAGPATKVNGFERAFRPLYVRVTLDDELYVTEAVTCSVRGGQVHAKELVPVPGPSGVEDHELVVNHGYVTAFSADEVAIDLKPDVLRADLETRARAQAIDMVVLHATGGPLVGNSLNTGLDKHKKRELKRDAQGNVLLDPVTQKPTGEKVVVLDASGQPVMEDPYCPHYEMDLDGHIVKLAEDDNRVMHSGDSYFYFHDDPGASAGTTGAFSKNVGSRSIGIELTHLPGRAYPDRMIVSLLGLLSRLKSAHGVKPWRFVGHCDTLVDPFTLVMDDDRIRCPSRDLDWPRLEAAGFGRKSEPRKLSTSDYAGFFLLTRDELRAAQKQARPLPPALRLGDDDAKKIWGGVKWAEKAPSAVLAARSPTFKDIVKELQGDLKLIGYSVDENGRYDTKTERAVAHFMAHTFSGPRKAAYQEAVPVLLESLVEAQKALGLTPPIDDATDVTWVVDAIPTNISSNVQVTRLVASYIKGTVDGMRAP